MVDYREFSKQIKEKYPEYQGVDDLKLANAMIEKYPEYKAQVTFENSKTKRPRINPNIMSLNPLIPSPNPIEFDKGLIKGISSLGVGLGKNVTNKYLRPLIGKEPLSEEELDKAYGFLDDNSNSMSENVGNFVGSAAPYFMLPELAPIKGTSAAVNFGNNVINLGSQGAIIGGLEGLKNEGIGQIIPNAITGGTIGAALPLAQPALNLLPMAGGFLSRTIGRLQPETLEQAVKPNSRALDLNTKSKLQDYATSLTNRVRNTYDDILRSRGEAVKNAETNLNQLQNRVNVNDVIDDINSIYNQQTYGNGNIINDVAPNLRGEMENLVNSRLIPEENLRNEINQITRNNSYSKRKENEAFDILSRATGKSVSWLKSQLNAATKGKGTIKRNETIESMLDKVDDKLDLTKSSNTGELDYNFYDDSLLNSADKDAGYNLAQQAYDDIINRRFNVNTKDPLSTAINSAEQDYNVLLNDVIDNAQNGDIYAIALDKIENITKNLPDALKEEYINRLSRDLDKIYNARNTISPYELQGIKRTVGIKTPFSEKGADVINGFKEQVYGKLMGRLENLSPELQAANKDFAALKRFENKEGTSRILQRGDKVDSATTALDNFDTSYSKGNTAQNVKDLENVFKSEGYEPFVNDVEDIVAAKDLNNIRTTGDSFWANVGTNLTRPALKLARAYNRTPIPNALYRAKTAGKKLFLPLMYNTRRLFGDVEYNDY